MKKVISLILFLFFGLLLFGQQANERVIAKTGVTLPPDPPKKQQEKRQKEAPGQQSYGHQAVLTWTAPTTCTDGSPCTATSYNIYKLSTACPTGAGASGATKIASTSAPTTTYTDTNIVAPGSYCWYVTAINANGESTASNGAGGTLNQPAISAPSNFTVTAQ